MGFLSGLFGSKKSTVTQEPLIPDWQLQTGQNVSDLLLKYLPTYIPGKEYTGDFVANPSAIELSGLDRLKGFLSSPDVGELFSSGKQNVIDTLGGKFADPESSPFIKAMLNLSKMNLQDSIDQSRRSAGSRGSYFTRSAMQDENKLRERAQNYTDAEIGKYIENERNRQFSAVPLAQQMDQYQNFTAPLGKVEASQTFGAFERMIEQANLEAQYGDFMRKQGELGGLIGNAEQLYGTNVPYGVKSMTTKSPSTFMSMMGEVLPIVGSYNTHKYGYDVNQSSISKALQSMISALGG